LFFFFDFFSSVSSLIEVEGCEIVMERGRMKEEGEERGEEQKRSKS